MGCFVYDKSDSAFGGRDITAEHAFRQLEFFLIVSVN
jgi:hypothetical protein